MTYPDAILSLVSLLTPPAISAATRRSRPKSRHAKGPRAMEFELPQAKMGMGRLTNKDYL
jgi:hypothetical protein